MATSYIKKDYTFIYTSRQTSSSQEIDISRYIQGGSTQGTAFLVVTRTWTTFINDCSGLYLITSIQSGAYYSVVELVRQSRAPSITLSGTTMTVTWPNETGFVSILPIMAPP